MSSTSHATGLECLIFKRKEYGQPQLVHYGAVSVLTKSGASGTPETGTNSHSCAGGPNTALPCTAQSDLRCKQNVVRMGTHSSGYGLYLYNYLPEFVDRMGTGKFFGVMAQELLLCHPEAVVVESSGYYAVNYSALDPVQMH